MCKKLVLNMVVSFFITFFYPHSKRLHKNKMIASFHNVSSEQLDEDHSDTRSLDDDDSNLGKSHACMVEANVHCYIIILHLTQIVSLIQFKLILNFLVCVS